MNLIKEQWSKSDIQPFLSFLQTYQQKEKEAWARNILNTKLDLLVIPTKVMYNIVDDIYKGNYRSYLELEIFDYYETIAIYGKLLTKISNFKEMLPYLTKYCEVMENWAHCDLLSFPIQPDNQQDYIQLSHDYSKDSRPLVRRLSLMILFQMVKDETILPLIFDHLIQQSNEQEYYVIMMAGWLLSECIIQHKEPTLQFLKEHPHLNKKIVNKGIQKCRESRRLSQEEKDALNAYKRK